MKYLTLFEKYTQKDIDKRYYVWTLPDYPVNKVGVIKILEVTPVKIRYITIRRTDWRSNGDFFTGRGEKPENPSGDIVTLKKWKRDKHNILFETDIEKDAWDFLGIYITYKNVNRNNWEMYRDSEKYNL